MTRALSYLRALVRRQVEQEGIRPLAARTGIQVGQIRSLLSERALLSTTIASVSEALGLEFYVGPPRDTQAGGELQTTNEQPSSAREKPPAWVHDLRSDLIEDLARLFPRDAPREEEALSTSEMPPRLRRHPGTRPVAVRRLQTAAGSGAQELDESKKSWVYFRQNWLLRHGLVADRCSIIKVMGKSMEPTLPDGCVILLNHDQRRRRTGRIFVIRKSDGLVVKRVGKDEAGDWLLVSDHPAWEPEPWSDAKVIGEVRWMAQEW